MYVLCVICFNEKHPSHPERSFHRFPKNEEMKKKWVEAIRSHCSATDGMICSDHFLPEDFCEPVGCGYVPKRLLQENAVPKLKIVGLSMTDVRLHHDNVKKEEEDIEQRVVVHSLDSSGNVNAYCKTETTENNTIKQSEMETDLFDFFTQCNESLNFDNENRTLGCENANVSLSYSNECVPLNSDYENVPLNFDNESIPLICGFEDLPFICGNENIPLNSANENVPLSYRNENIPLNCGNENIPLSDGNENITDPDLKRIISGNVDIIDLHQKCNNSDVKLNSSKEIKFFPEDYLETKLKRVVIRMPDLGLRSFIEDDFTTSLAWKIFVKFILHNRKETRALKHKTVRLQQKIDSYKKMFDILRKGGKIRIESKS